MKFDLNKQNVWVTSDTHWGHSNICRGTSQWDLRDSKSSHQSTRDFDTIEEMNQAILNGINNSVKEDDILIHLGDWSFGGIDNIWNFRKQINCASICLAYGNHDHHIKNNKILPNVFCDFGKDGKTIIFVDSSPHKYKDWRDSLFEINSQNLFTSVSDILNFGITSNNIKGKLRFFCSHYAHRIWNQSHHGVMHLYGHSHSTLEHDQWGKSMDVGIDNAIKLLGEYRPFNILEVYDILKVRDTHIIDHHNQLTN